MTAIRLTDAERDAAAADLAEHYALGRLSVDEHAERLDAIWTARTGDDLAPMFLDLPPLAPTPRAAVRRRRPRRPAFLFLAILAVLIVLVVLTGLTGLTKLPVVLLALVIGALLFCRRGHARGCSREFA